MDAGVDYVALDGFGGGTGATTSHIKENMGVPLLSALPRAYNYLLDVGVKDKVSLIAGGGLRSSADFARAVGKDDVSKLNASDLVSMNKDLAEITGVKWLK